MTTRSAAEVIKEELGTVAGFHTTAEWSERVLAALKRNGFAVIQLPAPDDGGPDEDGQLFFDDYEIRVDNTGRDHPGDIWTDFGLGREVLRCFNPNEVRHRAAALLAAAAAAEAVSA